MIKTGLLF